MCIRGTLSCALVTYLHLGGFGLVLSIEELWQSSALDGVNTEEKQEDESELHKIWDWFYFQRQLSSHQ